jgi:hypothetical protein
MSEQGESRIDINGLPKPLVLCALYNMAKGDSILARAISHAMGPMPYRVAKTFFGEHGSRLGAVAGRVLSVDISSESFDPTEYDRANGEGMAAKAIGLLRGTAALEQALSAVAVLVLSWRERTPREECLKSALLLWDAAEELHRMAFIAKAKEEAER